MRLFPYFQAHFPDAVRRGVTAGFFTEEEATHLPPLMRAMLRAVIHTGETGGPVTKIAREGITNAVSPVTGATYIRIRVRGPVEVGGTKGFWFVIENDVWGGFTTLKDYINPKNIFDLDMWHPDGGDDAFNRDGGGSREDTTVMPSVLLEVAQDGRKEKAELSYGVPVFYQGPFKFDGNSNGSGTWKRSMFIPSLLFDSRLTTTLREVVAHIQSWCEAHLYPNGKDMSINGKKLRGKTLGKQLGDNIPLGDIGSEAYLRIEWLKSRGTKAEGYLVNDGMRFPCRQLYFYDQLTHKRYHGIAVLPSGYVDGADLDLYKSVKDEVMDSPRFKSIVEAFMKAIGQQLAKPTRTPIDKHLIMRANARDVLDLAKEWGMDFGEFGSSLDDLVCVFNEDADVILAGLPPKTLMSNPMNDPENAESWRTLLVLRELGEDGEDAGHGFSGRKGLHLAKLWMRRAGYTSEEYICRRHYMEFIWTKGEPNEVVHTPPPGGRRGPFSEIVNLTHPLPDGRRYNLTIEPDPQTGRVMHTVLEMASVAIRYGTFSGGTSPGGSAMREMKVDAMADAFCDLAENMGKKLTKDDRERANMAFRFFDTTGKKTKKKSPDKKD